MIGTGKSRQKEKIMNLNQLQYFVALARVQHFGKAAESLGITQPSFSYAIAQLEEELGVMLFDRKGRPPALTEEGPLFLDYAERSLDILDHGVREMRRIAAGQGTIRMGFLRTLGLSFVPDLASDFLKTCEPGTVRFEFHSGLSQPLLQELKEDIFDVVFCTKMEDDPLIEYVPVSRQDLVLIVPEGHPLAGCRETALEETIPYPQIFFSPCSGLRPVIDQLFEKTGKKPKIAYEVEEDQVIAGLVSRGFGIAVVPYMEELERMKVQIIQISSPAWERSFYMATLKRRHLTPLVEHFRQFALENCRF